MRIATRALGDKIHDREALGQRAAYIALRMVGTAGVAAGLFRPAHHELARLEPTPLLSGEIGEIALAVGGEEQMGPGRRTRRSSPIQGSWSDSGKWVKTERA